MWSSIKNFFIFCIFLSSLSASDLKGFLTQEDITLFYKQGYLLKPKCLKPEEMESLNAQISTAINDALEQVKSFDNPIFAEEDQFFYMGGSRIAFKRRPDHSLAISRINGCSGMQPELLNTVRSEKMVHTFFELLGTSELEHIISQVHPKLPGDRVVYPRHRDIQFRKMFDPDWKDILGNGSYAICIIPIDPMTPENGGLWIDRNNYPEPQGQEEDIMWIHAEPGDLLFMHPMLYHGSGPNTSVNSRKTLLTGFSAFGANHRAYPGAHVNAHLRLTDEGTIDVSPAPWSEGPVVGPVTGH